MKIAFLILLCLFSFVGAWYWPDCVDNDPMCTKKNMVCGFAKEGATSKHCLTKCETDEQCDHFRRCVSGGCQMKPQVAQNNFV